MIARLVLLAVLLASPASADDLWIVFGSFRGGDFTSSVYSIRPDGSEERELSIHPAGMPASLDPWVTPNGELVAFTRGGGSHRSAVWVLDPAGALEEQITGIVMVRMRNGRAWPSLRPGSNHLTYVREEHSMRRIMLQEWPDGAAADLGKGEFPSWSRDGQSLVHIQMHEGLPTLWIHDFESGMREEIETTLDVIGYPTWSPDGSSLLVAAKEAGGDDLYELDLEGNILRQLTNTPESPESAPSWSPDGRYIAWSALASEPADGWQMSIYVLDVESGETSEITSGRYHDSRPTWAEKQPGK